MKARGSRFRSLASPARSTTPRRRTGGRWRKSDSSLSASAVGAGAGRDDGRLDVAHEVGEGLGRVTAVLDLHERAVLGELGLHRERDPDAVPVVELAAGQEAVEVRVAVEHPAERPQHDVEQRRVQVGMSGPRLGDEALGRRRLHHPVEEDDGAVAGRHQGRHEAAVARDLGGDVSVGPRAPPPLQAREAMPRSAWIEHAAGRSRGVGPNVTPRWRCRPVPLRTRRIRSASSPGNSSGR